MSEPEVLLKLDQVTTYYGQMRILEGISLQVREGELVCLLGGNASGKSTTLKTILGIVRPRSGRVLLRDRDVTQWPVPQRIAAGIAIVPENRRLFGQLTVRENLELGAVLRKGESLSEDFDKVHALFPRLLERRAQLAGTLSGGEQQMVAMGRALMSRPRLLLMDEPSMGLSPALVQQNFQIIKTIHASGVSVLMVEQNATMALSIADRGYVLSTGEIVLEGPAAELLSHEDLKRAYLGSLGGHGSVGRAGQAGLVGEGLDSQRAEREVLGDLGVGHAGRYQRDDLALAVGQRVEQAGRHGRAGVVQREEAGDQAPGGGGREQGVAAGNRPDRVDQHVRARSLAEESAGPGAQRLENVLVDLEGGQDQDLHPGQVLVGRDLAGRRQAVELGHPDVHQHDVGPGLARQLDRLPAGRRLSDHG